MSSPRQSPPSAENKSDPPTLLSPGNDEPYNSEEDSDFDINAPAESEDDAGAASEAGSSNEADYRPRKRRRLTPTPGKEANTDEYIVDDTLDSGDEATIRNAKQKRKQKQRAGKRGGKDGSEDEADNYELDEDDGESGGGFVRTRAMKMKMQEERKPLAKTDGATVDVDVLWAQMNAPKSAAKPPASEYAKKDTSLSGGAVRPGNGRHSNSKPSRSPVVTGEETITIKRTYKFAGEVITEEKTVPKNSAEAKLFLASYDDGVVAEDKPQADEVTEDSRHPLRRPLQRWSRFDPNSPGAYKRSWTMPPQLLDHKKDTANTNAAAPPVSGPKLNTVMKSKLDWAAYVDEAGIQNELDAHSRAKEGYMGRMDFLNRVEAKREEERKNARLQTK
ncbi:swr complex subunit [Ophidiomyces ophidiicola]|nr:swr complex subunit [Ophidiomyces ophidiicola]KAI1986081.1 swr complex subunit [Ophidiomyces ophidiicola]KAI1988459.1 swr complex subunit [Ophidiomyces ophidiicola]KAI1988872.1 swr complex subunit [Ophidiomyces ophidiicola]